MNNLLKIFYVIQKESNKWAVTSFVCSLLELTFSIN
jgi:hypothetical protein